MASTVLVLSLVAATAAPAEEDGEDRGAAATTATFLAGAAAAFGMHEAGHLAFDLAFDAHPYVKEVSFGDVPFFAVAHAPGLSPRREFTISSAGFWVQHATDEWLLSRRPELHDRAAPFAKGMFAFNVLTSIGYSAAAFARAGPYERDTRGIASAIRVDERAIGAIILAPALLDGYRYYHPNSRWAKWVSRAAKIGGGLLVLR